MWCKVGIIVPVYGMVGWLCTRDQGDLVFNYSGLRGSSETLQQCHGAGARAGDDTETR